MSEQPWIFDREEELAALRQRLSKCRSLLVHGPAGVGKTLLIRSLLPDLPLLIYSSESTTIHVVFRTIAAELLRRGSERIRKAAGSRGVEGLNAKSAISLKGVVRDALREAEYCLVLDHVQRPSTAFAAVIRDLIVGCETPIVAVARSAHMEDVGFLHSIFGDRPDRYELRNFKPEVASAFARTSSERVGLNAANLNEFLDRAVELSDGNPGAILAMLNMALQPRYRLQESIKTAPLYIDFRINWAPVQVRLHRR